MNCQWIHAKPQHSSVPIFFCLSRSPPSCITSPLWSCSRCVLPPRCLLASVAWFYYRVSATSKLGFLLSMVKQLLLVMFVSIPFFYRENVLVYACCPMRLFSGLSSLNRREIWIWCPDLRYCFSLRQAVDHFFLFNVLRFSAFLVEIVLAPIGISHLYPGKGKKINLSSLKA